MAVMTNTIIAAVVVHLVEKLITDVPEDDISRAGLVRAGRLQDDPTRPRATLLVHPNDPQDEGWRHELAKTDTGIEFATPWEVGGGHLEWLRFTANLELFYMKSISRVAAQESASTLLTRARAALWSMAMPQGVSDFGESAIKLVVCSSYIREGGGPPDYIWRGDIHFQVLIGVTGA